MALESLVADPKAFELSVDKLEGDFTLLSLFDHAESFEIGTSPLLLLPVRIETRFFGDDLKIRVYPDQLQLDDHAPLLTEREVALGVAYWERRLDGEPDAARDDLVRELPPRRAVWVARETRPTVAKSGERVYPDLNTRRNAPPATAALMPDRWCAIGFVGNTRAFVAWGSEIPTPLHCSPDLADLVAFEGGDEALPVDDAMAWMVDYERAIGVGMAITVDVSDVAIGDDGLTLFVAGVRGELNNEAALLTLLEAHHYSDGLDVMAQGTPTNNTDEAIAGWSAAVDDVAALFERELDDDGLAGVDAVGGGPARYSARPGRSHRSSAAPRRGAGRGRGDGGDEPRAVAGDMGALHHRPARARGGPVAPRARQAPRNPRVLQRARTRRRAASHPGRRPASIWPAADHATR